MEDEDKHPLLLNLLKEQIT